MSLVLSKDKPTARYEQVKLYIIERIETGEWAIGHRLPSESELVELLGVSRMTVHRALRELTAEGLVTRAQGVGTFVAEPAQRVELLELRDIADDIASNGHEHTTRIITLDTIRANSDLATAFEQRPGARLFHSIIVHYEDDTPLQVEERFVSPHFAPDYLDQDFSLTHPHRHLSGISHPEEIEHVVFAVTPSLDICTLLELDEPEACLQLMRRTWVEGRVVMKGIFTYSGSRFSFVGRYRP
ncbi:histidine utilization repressor [Komagataeibacter nataicola]|uniref:Histidine utilization repressor n=1 Tax=Komagataeibacter nataicola TaxID=265960 RepID=A0A9N7CZK8_9PROT|nr:histidine utilization repressor [Komagataeibacter nataicola]AQU88726.1 histidine utilization repressor [Komagataeibacter nataicola]PYD67264.1 histidine utilization repressor [Komagataeibacter nataicola]WEQ57021.1 histidine utilization repressor [Komagataeibacter nataicola]WNM08547.1 histidine utilization repressor [Komagataeibacter nataicola]GBR16066.1 histidine utilization repressor [Komagataeibacter nataicola NRIC 0616]